MAHPAPAPIAAGKVVHFHYTLTDGDGKVLDSSRGSEPMAYLHGAGNIVPGLERRLEGCFVGDSFDAVVAPADGYGERNPSPSQPVPRAAFPDGVDVEPGMQFMTEHEGEPVPLWVDRVEGDQVWIDLNHPLSGVTLHFAVEVTGVRDATRAEIDHGHPHDPGDPHHGHPH